MAKSNTVVSSNSNKTVQPDPVVVAAPPPAPALVAEPVVAAAPAPAPIITADPLATTSSTASDAAAAATSGTLTTDTPVAVETGVIAQDAPIEAVVVVTEATVSPPADVLVLDTTVTPDVMVAVVDAGLAPVVDAAPPASVDSGVAAADAGVTLLDASTLSTAVAADTIVVDTSTSNGSAGGSAGGSASSGGVGGSVDSSSADTLGSSTAPAPAPSAPAPVGAPEQSPFSSVANADVAAQALLAADSGITIVGYSKLDAASQAVALYDGSQSGLSIGAGLLLTSGATPGTVNTMTGFGADNFRVGDAGLTAVVDPIFHTMSYDAASLSFTFTVDPTLNANSVSFNIVFGSEEFPEWIDSFVDAAAVWVNGTNYAMFNHDTYSPLSVVSQNVAAGYFIDNFDGHLATEYDGVSRLLKITAPIHAGDNTIRIAIADTGDHILDSGIFIADLKAGTSNGSGVTSVDHQGTSLDDSAYGSGMAEYFDLSSGDDILTAGAGDDIIDGGTGNDDIAGDDGNDAISGGAGDDSARYHGNQADFSVALATDGSYVVTDLRVGSAEGTDNLTGIEKLHFDDGTFYIESLVASQAPELVTTGLAPVDTTPPATPAVDTVAADAQAALDAQAAAEELAALQAIAAAQTQAALDEQAALDVQADALAADAAAAQAAAEAAAAAAEVAAAQAAAAEVAAAQAAQAAAAEVAAAQAAQAAAAEVAAAQAAQAAQAAAAEAAAAAELTKLLAGLTVAGTAANDNLVGNLGSDTLDGGLGADSMAGGAGSDAYYVDDKKDVVSELAAEGNDTVFAATSYTLSANVENITLTGIGGNDAAGNALDNILTGNSGKNVLSGGAGNDVIEGGGGIDQLTGGSGNDYFVFSSVSDSLVGKKHDVITDFQQGDILDLSDIDAIIGTSTDDAFSYIGASAFSHEAGQLQFDAATGNLSGDVNGDGKADFEIHLNSVSSFAFDSFQL